MCGVYTNQSDVDIDPRDWHTYPCKGIIKPVGRYTDPGNIYRDPRDKYYDPDNVYSDPGKGVQTPLIGIMTLSMCVQNLVIPYTDPGDRY